MATSFKNQTVGLHVFYVFNIHIKFCINQILFTIQSINLFFMHYFKLLKLKFIQLIDDMTIDL